MAHSYEFIKDEIKALGGLLLSESYVNAHSKLLLKCSCGSNFSRTWTKIQSNNSVLCTSCAYKKSAANRRGKYKLKPKPKCKDCGKELSRYDAKRCGSCIGILGKDLRKTKPKPMAGKDNPSYKDGKSLTAWKNRALKKSKQCDCCGYKGNALVAHHLYSRSFYPELATDDSNAVVICANCHMEFHKWAPRDCTESDYIKFKEIKNGVSSTMD